MLERDFVYELIARYYTVGSEAYNILVRHGQDVASMALDIANRHANLGADTEFLWEAAMLHDIGIFRTNAPGIECYGDAPYIYHGYLGAELLRSLGLSAHAHVAERHTGSGLTRQDLASQGLELPEGIYEPQTLEERIICYADKFYSKTKLGVRQPIGRVRSKMLRHGPEALNRFEALHQDFAL